jgi:mono/diheme cytochrome c family protein
MWGLEYRGKTCQCPSLMHTVAIVVVLLFITGQANACQSDDMELVQKGKQLFNGSAVCWECHGTDADGKTNVTPDVEQLNPKPTDLRNPAVLRLHTDMARYNAIRDGIPGTGMPPFRGMLYENEIQLLIEYLEVLKAGGC